MRKLRAFDLFTQALATFEEKDKSLYDWPRNRLALTHSLAVRLEETIPEGHSELNVDMCPVLSKSKKALNPDIVVHNRKNGQIALALVCRSEYLSEEEQQALMELNTDRKCDLVLALSFFPQKQYMLIYRATAGKIEYFHFDRNTLTTDVVRKRTVNETPESSEQLKLRLK